MRDNPTLNFIHVADATESQARNAEVVLAVVGDFAARGTTVSGQIQEVGAGVNQQTTAVGHVSSVAAAVGDISTGMSTQFGQFDLSDETTGGRRREGDGDERARADGEFEFGYRGTPSSNRGR
ncbi:hypothetical protein [Halogranum amylolyticum]|uniref:hypothetical protein n=1 Tax=Halogranum amylolyticum TaxID=660520 RepID=UPI000B7D3DC8|nr:hypothetical protein [Halogranum amylolyticum]